LTDEIHGTELVRAFALNNTWPGSDVPAQERNRLAVLGARVLDRS
jgi:hypothetical protein